MRHVSVPPPDEKTATRCLTDRVRRDRLVLDVLEQTPEAGLTLVTCYPFNFLGNAPKRFIVRVSWCRNGLDPEPPSETVRKHGENAILMT